MSTDLSAYLNYMSAWTAGSDDDIQSLINEHGFFVSLGDFDPEPAIDSEFGTLDDMATTVRDETIAADAIQISADAAAVASIWSFGLGMAAFAVLEAEATIMRAAISSQSNDLNAKLTTVDTDIATLVGPTVAQYIAAYKANNDIVAAQKVEGMDGQTCRSVLLQFMAQIELDGAELNVANFRKYANSARLLLNGPEIQAIYDALDTFNLSQQSDDDLQTCLGSIKGFTFPDSWVVTMVRVASLGIMANRLNVATDKLAKFNEAEGLVGDEAATSVFEMMDCWGKFFVGIAVIASVADIVLQILDIVDVVEQTQKMVDELNGDIKANYSNFYNSIKTAAQTYNSAMAKKSGNTS